MSEIEKPPGTSKPESSPPDNPFIAYLGRDTYEETDEEREVRQCVMMFSHLFHSGMRKISSVMTWQRNVEYLKDAEQEFTIAGLIEKGILEKETLFRFIEVFDAGYEAMTDAQRFLQQAKSKASYESVDLSDRESIFTAEIIMRKVFVQDIPALERTKQEVEQTLRDL